MQGRIATIGFFDGVHKGHCYLFEHLQEEAAKRDLAPLIVTFYEHPRAALQSDYIPQLLSTIDERKALLSAYGEVLMLPFADIKELTAAEFIRYLKDRYQVEAIVMGYDHRFGSDRLKHPQEYRSAGMPYGVEVITMGEFIDGEWHVSSTEIRAALENGNIVVANELLGRPYSISGKVVKGNAIGRNIGFPTANIAPDDPHKIIPKCGVYAARVDTPTMDCAPAFVNIGNNPTIGNKEVTIEVHIPSFKGDLYDQHLEIHFERYIREERQFDSLDELREQIKADIDSSLRRDA